MTNENETTSFEEEVPQEQEVHEELETSEAPITEESETEETPKTESSPEDDLKSKAKSTGHLSEEEYRKKFGSLRGYKTEKEYTLTGELIDLKKTLQKRDQDIEEILTYQKNVISQQKVNFRKQLEDRLAEARALGNVNAVESLTAERTKMDVEARHEEFQRASANQQQAVQGFVERNKVWFNDSNPDLIQRVKELDAIYTASTKSYEELAQKIEKHMKAEMSIDPRYSQYVRATQAPREPVLSSSQSAVNSQSSRSSNVSEDKLYSKLSNNEKAMYQVTKRIAAKVNSTYSVKDFVEAMKKDEEI